MPVDGSDPAAAAVEYALEQFGDEELTALYVIDPVDGATAWGPGAADDWLASAEERAEGVLEEVTERAAAAHDVETDSTVGRPARTIVEYADAGDFDHVVVGSHGREGISRVLLGSVAETVVGARHRRPARGVILPDVQSRTSASLRVKHGGSGYSETGPRFRYRQYGTHRRGSDRRGENR